MHREQLEQVQLQQQVNSTTAAKSTHVSLLDSAHTHTLSFTASSSTSSPTSSSMQVLANTVDQASAQFAASAVITADQLLALKTKEELGPGGGVNGVLAPSGIPSPSTLPLFTVTVSAVCAQFIVIRLSCFELGMRRFHIKGSNEPVLIFFFLAVLKVVDPA